MTREEALEIIFINLLDTRLYSPMEISQFKSLREIYPTWFGQTWEQILKDPVTFVKSVSMKKDGLI